MLHSQYVAAGALNPACAQEFGGATGLDAGGAPGFSVSHARHWNLSSGLLARQTLHSQLAAVGVLNLTCAQGPVGAAGLEGDGAPGLSLLHARHFAASGLLVIMQTAQDQLPGEGGGGLKNGLGEKVVA